MLGSNFANYFYGFINMWNSALIETLDTIPFLKGVVAGHTDRAKLFDIEVKYFID